MADHPSIRTAANAAEICNRLKEGKLSLRKVCADLGISDSAVRQWAFDEPEAFGAEYAHARYIGYMAMADDVIETAETPLEGVETEWSPLTGLKEKKGDMLGHRRLVVDTKKWLLSKVLPKIYGDRLAVEHSGSVEIEDRLRAGRNRVGGGDA